MSTAGVVAVDGKVSKMQQSARHVMVITEEAAAEAAMQRASVSAGLQDERLERCGWLGKGLRHCANCQRDAGPQRNNRHQTCVDPGLRWLLSCTKG